MGGSVVWRVAPCTKRLGVQFLVKACTQVAGSIPKLRCSWQMTDQCFSFTLMSFSVCPSLPLSTYPHLVIAGEDWWGERVEVEEAIEGINGDERGKENISGPTDKIGIHWQIQVLSMIIFLKLITVLCKRIPLFLEKYTEVFRNQSAMMMYILTPKSFREKNLCLC